MLPNVRLLFLDIDGVIVSARTKFLSFDPVAVQLIKELCMEHGFKIVCSSTWRFDRSTLPKLQDAFGKDLIFTHEWRTGMDKDRRGI